MSPITHLLASWSVADALGLRDRDRTLATLCGVLPDADGLGAVVDLTNGLLGRPDSWTYGQLHHLLLHGLPGAVLIPLVLSIWAVRRLRTFAVGVLCVHLHLLCDLAGSRGPGEADIWPIHYLAPFSSRLTFAWAGQWPLNDWPNILLTLLLIGYAFFRAIASGYSPVALFSARAERVFVEAVRRRWSHR